VTQQVAGIYLKEAFADGFHHADTLVLGCTHYPLLQPLLHRVAPSQVSIVDSAESTARVVATRLKKLLPVGQAHEERRGQPRLKFFATDSVEKFRRLGERFLGHSIEDVQHVDLKE
jgi:glutamate racemase